MRPWGEAALLDAYGTAASYCLARAVAKYQAIIMFT